MNRLNHHRVTDKRYAKQYLRTRHPSRTPSGMFNTILYEFITSNRVLRIQRSTLNYIGYQQLSFASLGHCDSKVSWFSTQTSILILLPLHSSITDSSSRDTIIDMPSIRRAYIRTVEEPDKPYDQTYQFLETFVKQRRPDDALNGPRHVFLFGGSNTHDAHIFEVFRSYYIVGRSSRYDDLQRSDLELRMSESRAATGAGQRVLERCDADGIRVVISGATDSECNDGMLQDCDYVIDRWTWENYSWFWNTARPGVPQETVLTNPKYDMSKHDVSKIRLGNRYAGYGWKANSGCSHGNGGSWRCRGCGGSCKRGRCRVNPPAEESGPEWMMLPDKRSIEWRELTANDACMRMLQQRIPGRYNVRDMYSSIDTFSGD
jgi:hypothetical protein